MAADDRARSTRDEVDSHTGQLLLNDALPPVPQKAGSPAGSPVESLVGSPAESPPRSPAESTAGASADSTAASPHNTRAQHLLPGEPRPHRIDNFPGSYYYKAASSQWHWSGMEATVKLGSPNIDPKRVDAKGRALDGFSIYLGGNANGKHEIDAGLTWDYPADSAGKVDKSHKEWRPFYRNGAWHWADKEKASWKPGDTVAISVSMVAPGKMHMHIADAAKNSTRHADVDFAAPGFNGKNAVQFKRVNAIDQVATEGKTVHPTHSKILDTAWLSTNLTHDTSKGRETVPFNRIRQSTLQTPVGHIRVRHTKEQESVGAESVEIRGSIVDQTPGAKKP